MTSPEYASTELKVLGVRIAVDDFGTGFSSLSHLRTLPIDELKIDKSFIAAMETSEQARTLVHSLIQLGAALGINTVAEGIEDMEQLVHLRAEDCTSRARDTCSHDRSTATTFGRTS